MEILEKIDILYTGFLNLPDLYAQLDGISIIKKYSFVLIFLIFCIFIGKTVLTRAIFSNALEKICFELAVGLGIFGTICILLGLCGMLFPHIILGLCVGFIFLTFINSVRKIRNKKWKMKILYDKKSFVVIFVILWILILFMPVIVLPTLPSVGFDDGAYHLSFAKLFAETGKIQLSSSAMYPTFSFFMETIYAVFLFVYADGTACQVLEFLLYFAIAGVMVAMGKRFYHYKTGIVAAALWLSSPLLFFQCRYAYVDIAFTFFVFMAIYAFLVYMQKETGSWIILSGMFLGVASSIKYSGLGFCALLGMIVLFRVCKTKELTPVFLYGIPIVCFSLPNYLFNFMNTGNPVFPFYPNIFGSTVWSLEESIKLWKEIHNSYGLPKNIINIMKFPYLAVFEPHVYFGEGGIHIAYYLLLPFLFVPVMKQKKKISGYLIFFSAGYFGLWYTGSQVLRYMGVVLAIIALPMADIIYAILNKKGKVMQYACYSILIFFLAFSLWEYGLEETNTILIPVTQEEKNRYLSQKVFPYEGVQFLNDKDKNATVYTMYVENVDFYCDFNRIGGYQGKYSYKHLDFGSGKELYDSLKKFDADYFVNTTHRYQKNIPNDDFFHKHFMPVWSESEGTIYKLTDKNIDKKYGAEMLKNDWYITSGNPQLANNSIKLKDGDQMFHVINYGDYGLEAFDLLEINTLCDYMEGSGSVTITLSWMKNGNFLTSSNIILDKDALKKKNYITVKQNADSISLWINCSSNKARINNISVKKIDFLQQETGEVYVR